MWLVQASEIRAEVIDTIGQAGLIIHYYLFPHSQPEQRVTWVSRGGKCPQTDRACVCIWSTHELANQRECTPPPTPHSHMSFDKATEIGEFILCRRDTATASKSFTKTTQMVSQTMSSHVLCHSQEHFLDVSPPVLGMQANCSFRMSKIHLWLE